MKKQRTFQEYRTMDLALFGLMLAVFEFIIIKVSNSSFFYDHPFTVSLAGALTAIVYMRWGAWGGFEAALAGFIYCFFSGATVNQFMIYIAGNLFSLLAVLLLEKLGYEYVRNAQWYLAFPLLVILLMQAGRAVVALLLGAAPTGILGFFTTDALSDLFTVLIVWITKRLDGIYENQKHYLLRVHKEEKEKRGQSY